MRIDKINYYLNIAEAVLERSTCLSKKYGAVIVNEDEVIATGYNGSPRGCVNCVDVGNCYRKDEKTGQGYEKCTSVHAEQNALLSAKRRDMIGGKLFLVGKKYENNKYVKNIKPCSICRRLIINAGLSKVFVRKSINNYDSFEVSGWKNKREDLLGIDGY